MTTTEMAGFETHERIIEVRRGRVVSVLADWRERLLASMGRGEANPAR